MATIIISICLLIALDQLTKLWALISLKPAGSFTVIGGVLDFTFVENTGASFGMLSGGRWLFIITTVIICLGLIYAFIKLPRAKAPFWINLSFVLIMSGAIGNLLDRVFRGYVVDFIEVTFIDYPVFNIADIFIVTGAILFAFLVLFVIKDEKKPSLKENNGKE